MITIETHDTEAFDSFEVTQEELDLFTNDKLPLIRLRSIEHRVLSKLTLDELQAFAAEADELNSNFNFENSNVMKLINAVVVLGLGDYCDDKKHYSVA